MVSKLRMFRASGLDCASTNPLFSGPPNFRSLLQILLDIYLRLWYTSTMDTPDNQEPHNDQDERAEDGDTFFSFSHGIRLTLESLGLEFDGETMQPILKRMESILSNAKHSLVKGDDSVIDWNQFRHLRKVEKILCAEYLRKVQEASEAESS